MTAEGMSTQNQRKFIPILRTGDWSEAAPLWLSGKVYVDLRRSPYSEPNYEDLLTTLVGTRAQAPPLGRQPRGARVAGQRVSPGLVQRIRDHGLGDAIADGIMGILTNPAFPNKMSLSGEVMQNPMWDSSTWDSSRIEAAQSLVDSFRPDGPNPPRFMPLDTFLIKGQDRRGLPRLLTYLSEKPHSGWQAHLLPFRQRYPEEEGGARLALDASDLAAFLGVPPSSVRVSIADGKYALSIKPDPPYHELVIYAFTFCYVRLLTPPKWLAHIDATQKLQVSARHFRWFHPEEFEQDADVMRVNADVVRAVHRLFGTTLPAVPLSVSVQFLLA